MNTPKDFQRYTAKRIVELFTKKGQYRVLLADEVGLGKTTVAAKVTAQVAAWHRAKGDREFNVVYVCSNLSIAQQNMRSLGFGASDTLGLGESRLSMQHLRIAQRRMESERLDRKMRWNSIPLTPGTSFSMTAGNGTAQERALIQLLLVEYLQRKFPSRALPDMRWMAFNAKVGWKGYLEEYRRRLEEMTAAGSDYVDSICGMFSERLEEYHSLIDDIYACGGDPGDGSLWARRCGSMRTLRQIFARISMSMLKPDLVIMDEFQRFSDLIAPPGEGGEESEVSALFRHFISCENELHTKVLLLSATPYRPYSTLDELLDGREEDHYTGFFKVVDFLEGSSERREDFREKWHEYSDTLASLTCGRDTIVRVKKKAEAALYDVMCRTERLGAGMRETFIPDYGGDGLGAQYPAYEYLAYAEMERLISLARGRGARLSFSHVPVDYIKSSPYIMSFMQNYRLKKDIEKSLEKTEEGGTLLPFRTSALYIDWDAYMSCRGLPMQNTKLSALRNMLLGDKFRDGCASLLWVPASNPYYTVPKSSVFSKLRDFSKVLVFSAWEMVPRMLSTVLSHEALCQTVEILRRRYPDKRKFADAESLAKDVDQIPPEQKALLAYPSSFLSGLYSPREFYGWNIADIRRKVRERLLASVDVNKKGARSHEALLEALRSLDSGQRASIHKMHVNALADMAIAAPGVCMMRMIGDREEALCAARTVLGIFNTSALRVIDAYCNGRTLKKILAYCVEGNLASVLDEYAHMVGGAGRLVPSAEEKGNGMSSDLERATQFGSGLYVDMAKQVGRETEIVREYLPTNIAVAFTQSKQDEKTASTITNVREAFNSPFRPFVLASTSVGQEGLDFHKYARKIVHWNLPSNPVDLEQREGRINRYECLAIRRNVARKYADKDHFTWEEIFRQASLDLKGDSDMVPYWYLPESFYNDGSGRDYEMIERIIPQYPFSYDQDRYKHLIDVLSLYRLTLGQPKQEELVKLLEKRNLSEEDIRALIMNLSPIRRK